MGQKWGNGYRICHCRYRLLRKDRAKVRPCDGVATVVKDTTPAFPPPLSYIPTNDVLVYDIGSPKPRLAVICIYRHLHFLGHNSQIGFPLIALFTFIFDNPLHLVLVGDFNRRTRQLELSLLYWTLHDFRYKISALCAQLPCC